MGASATVTSGQNLKAALLWTAKVIELALLLLPVLLNARRTQPGEAVFVE
jgi:hypothetical protein